MQQSNALCPHFQIGLKIPTFSDVREAISDLTLEQLT